MNYGLFGQAKGWLVRVDERRVLFMVLAIAILFRIAAIIAASDIDPAGANLGVWATGQVRTG